jgi:Na+/H+-translocating membrane pyrophosphatase
LLCGAGLHGSYVGFVMKYFTFSRSIRLMAESFGTRTAPNVMAESAGRVISTGIQFVVMGIGTLVAYERTGASGLAPAAVGMLSITRATAAVGIVFGANILGNLLVGSLISRVSPAIGYCISRFCSNYPGAAWRAAQSVPALVKEVDAA